MFGLSDYFSYLYQTETNQLKTQRVMRNQRSVFEFGNEYVCTEFYDVDTNHGGVEVNRNGVEHLGQIVGISIPDFDDEEESTKFDNEVIEWIVDNEH